MLGKSVKRSLVIVSPWKSCKSLLVGLVKIGIELCNLCPASFNKLYRTTFDVSSCL